MSSNTICYGLSRVAKYSLIAIRSPESKIVTKIFKTALIAIFWLLLHGVIFTILVPIMFPVAGKAFSDNDMAASPVKSSMAAMIAEQFVQLG